MKRYKTSYFKKFLSLTLSFLMLITNVFSQYTYVFAEDDVEITPQNISGFNFSLNWNTGDNPTELNWVTATPENKVIRLNVNYSNSSVETGYAAGELQITVPGIGGANRNGVKEAADVAADKADSEKKERDWSYTYDKETDTYTFTNNNAIEEKSNFSGSFEILWYFSARDIKNGYSKSIKATLASPTEIIDSNEVAFNFMSDRDTYTISETHARLSSKDGLGENYNNYIWVNWVISSNMTTKARGTSSQHYLIKPEENAIVKMAYNSNRTNMSISKTSEGYKVGYSEYPVTVTIGYPKDEYDGVTINNPVTLIGKYCDESQFSVLSSTNDSTVLNAIDYDFKYEDGILGINKESPNNSKIVYNQALNGTAEQNYYLYMSLYNDGAIYDVAVIDDILDVKLLDGTFRRLTDDEYAMKYIGIWQANSYRSGNNITLEPDKYDVEIYTRISGSNEYTLFETKKITSNFQNVLLPENTVGVQIKVKGLDVSIEEGGFTINVSYDLNENDVNIDPLGFVRNLMTVQLYQDDILLPNDATKESYTGDWKDVVSQRDLDLYGMYMVRSYEDVPFVEDNKDIVVRTETSFNEFNSKEKAYHSNIEINTIFENAESDKIELEKFSQYTILPKGMDIDVENFDFTITNTNLHFISGASVSQSYLESHINAEIIENYKGSGLNYVKFDYDFSDRPICVNGDEITVSFDVFVTEDNCLEFGETYMARAVSMIHDDKDNFLYHTRSKKDDGSYYTDADTLWSDIDNDGVTNETVTYDYESQAIIVAISAYQELQKSVMTNYTNSKYVVNDAVSLLNDAYSYKAKFRTGNSGAKNVVFYDYLETADGSEWKGTFKNVDTSYLEGKGFTPTVYYSSVENAGNLVDNASNWSTTKPDTVKSIAVDLGNQIVGANTLLYFIVNMTTPKNNSYIEKSTANDFNVSFMAVDKITGVETGQTALDSNVVTVELSEPIGDVTLVKTDATNGNKLSGAVYTLYNSSNIVVKDDLKTNSLGKITVNNLPFGSYYFLEKAAPTGYSVNSTKVSFTLNQMELDLSTTNERLKGSVQLHKTSSTDETFNVKGAMYSLYMDAADGGTDILIQEGLVTDEEGKTSTIENLVWGTYYFIETKAALGFELNTEKIRFEISKDNVGEVAVVKTTDQPKPASVVLTKKEILEDGVTLSDTFVSDASFSLYTDKDELVRENVKTDENGKITINDLAYGNYYFKENSARGYIVTDDKINFILNPSILKEEKEVFTELELATNDATYPWIEDNGVWKSGNKGVNNSTSTISFEPFTLAESGIISFDWACTSEGASWDYMYYTISKNGSTVSGTGTSTKIGGNSTITDPSKLTYTHVEKKLEPGTYTLSFTYRKDSSSHGGVDAGYIKNLTYSSKEILWQSSFDTDGNLVCSLNTNNTRKSGTTVLIKMNEDSEFLKNAVFSLYNSNDELVLDDLTTNEEGQLRVENLIWGEYYFLEKQAPEGYQLSKEKYEFIVNRDTVESNIVLTITNTKEKGKVTLTKVDETDETITLPNAVYTLYDIKENIIQDDLTTDENGQIKIEELEWGSYYFLEKKAPTGYSLSDEKIRFSVNAQNAAIVQELVAKDSMISNGTITITKRIEVDDIWFEHGLPTFLYKVVGTDILGNETTYYREINFSKDYVNEHTTEKTIELSAKITNLPVGTYILQEMSTIRYTTTEVIDIVGGTVENNVVAFTLSDIALDAKATYVNNKFIHELYSHNDNTTNIIKSHAMPTGIKVIANFTKIETDTVDRNLLVVTVFYDDGSSRVLGNDEYTIKPETLDQSMNGEYTLEITYIEKNKTMKASINTFVDVALPFTADVYNASGAKIGTYTPTSGVELSSNFANETPSFMVITGYTGSSDTVVFPEKIKGIQVEEIGMRNSSSVTKALSGLDNVKSISLTKGIKTINNNAFYYCNNLTGALVIPDSVTTIGNNAFSNCSGFTGSLVIPDSVTTIGTNAFYNCSGFTETLSIGNNVTSIGNAAFTNCRGFTGSLVIPDSVTIIGNNAFSNCSGFNGTLSIGNNVTTIGTSAFQSCNGFTGNLILPNSLKEIGAMAFHSCSGFTGSLVIPDSVTSILGGAFIKCTGFKGTLTLSNNLVSIGNTAFQGCKGFTGDLVIPDSVTSIGNNAFLGCSGFKGTLSIGNNVKTIGNGAFSSCTGFTGDLVIPDSVITIGDQAFQTCVGFKGTLSIGNNVKTIGALVFHGCQNLTGDLVIPDSVTSIGNGAFTFCKNLTGDIVLPTRVSSLNSTFYNCTSITSLTIYNENCSFLDNKVVPTTVTIKGWSNSTAETYASTNGNSFIPLDTIYEKRSITINDTTNGEYINLSSSQIYPNQLVLLTCNRENYQLISFKMNGIEVRGNEFIMPDENVVISDIKLVEPVVIESEHNPYANNLNYIVLGTWNIDDTTSVNITITYQTESASYDWISITAGADYVAGTSYRETRTYLAQDGSLASSTGTSSNVKIGGTTTTTLTFNNVNLPTGSVIFRTDSSGNNYYGVKVEIIPNYD